MSSRHCLLTPFESALNIEGSVKEEDRFLTTQNGS